MAESFREKLGDALDERYDKLLKVIDDGLAATKKTWVNCPHCKKKSEVEIQDVRGAITAAEFISANAHGRPGIAADGPEDQKITFVRIVASGDSDAVRIFDVAEKYIAPENRDAFLAEVGHRPGEKTT
jgi:hypothetical protein